MDPPLISEGSFTTANPSMAEIWPYSARGPQIGDVSGLLGLRMGAGSGDASGFGTSFMSELLEAAGGAAGLLNRDASIEESSVTEQTTPSFGRKRRAVSASTRANDLKEPIGKQMKLLASKEEDGVSKHGTEASSAGGDKSSEKNNQPTEPLKDFIHVRARRGQATDSHSLAERARREKISERMKLLQDLVPGCNKVIGKALVLDEIINYIQSLQRQVEFLSMKLEAVNSGINPAINGFPPKDPGPPNFDSAGMMYASQSGREYEPVMDNEWLHMHLGGGGGGGFERTT